MTTHSEDSPPWLEDENAFERHFGIAHSVFCELIKRLSEDQQTKYERTRETNTEAAILWAIHEGKSHGILHETSGADVPE